MISRRAVLGSVAAASAASAGFALGSQVLKQADPNTLTKLEPFRGIHQNGIELPLQAVTSFVALNLKPGLSKADALRWMRILTDDIDRLSRGQAVLADPHPELIAGPARLTVTVGFGPGLFAKLSLQDQMPEGFGPLPAFKIDRLRPEFSEGDVLLHISADDPISLSHSTRMLVLDSSAFATVHYVQSGFSQPLAEDQSGLKQRTLMGQIDGTDNPEVGTTDFENLVWINDGPAWIKGGTTLAFRRISMALNTWDTLGRKQQEQVIGRTLDNGAPLGGKLESDFPDFNATDESGLSVIPQFAHIRRAAASNGSERFFRRPFSYDLGIDSSGEPQVGLLWTAYAKNLEKQFVPVQKRLADFDLLNQWTTPIGSSSWAVARGVSDGEIIAEQLFA